MVFVVKIGFIMMRPFKPIKIRRPELSFSILYMVIQQDQIQNMKRCICHFAMWQIHPFISKEMNFVLHLHCVA